MLVLTLIVGGSIWSVNVIEWYIMRTLTTQSTSDLDTSSEQVVLEYTMLETLSIVAQVRMDGIVGGDYLVRLYIDSALVVPDRSVDTPLGESLVIAQSRNVIAAVGSNVEIRLTGRPADTNVDVVASLIDLSPLTADELTDTIIPVIADAVGDMELRPERTVLGRCRQPMAVVPKQIKQPIAVIPKPIKCPK